MNENINNIGIISDIIILSLIIMSSISGYRKGLAGTLVSFVRWISCIIIPIILTPALRLILIENTSIDESIKSHITVNLASTISESKPIGSNILANLNPPYSHITDTIGEGAASQIADSVTSLIISVIAFLTMLLICGLVSNIFVNLFTFKSRDTIASRINRFLGLSLGLFRGVIFVSIFMLILFPLLSLVGTDIANPVLHGIRKASLSNWFYFNNPILYFINLL